MKSSASYLNVDLKPKRGASENDETCAAYIPIFVSEFGKGSSAAFVIYRAIAQWLEYVREVHKKYIKFK